MSIPLICLLAAVLLPYVWTAASLPFRNRQFGNINLREPRVQAEQLSDAGARAWGAQANAWEALAVFAAAYLAAWSAGVSPEGNWATASMIWVAARLGHGTFYIIDQPIGRVGCFAGGLGMSLWIFVMALSA